MDGGLTKAPQVWGENFYPGGPAGSLGWGSILLSLLGPLQADEVSPLAGTAVMGSSAECLSSSSLCPCLCVIAFQHFFLCPSLYFSLCPCLPTVSPISLCATFLLLSLCLRVPPNPASLSVPTVSLSCWFPPFWSVLSFSRCPCSPCRTWVS